MVDEDLPVISFVEDVPGLPGLARCVLVALDDDASVFALRSVVDPDLRLLVVAPGAFFPDYSTEVDRRDRRRAGAGRRRTSRWSCSW